MKLTRERLKQIIKEELSELEEGYFDTWAEKPIKDPYAAKVQPTQGSPIGYMSGEQLNNFLASMGQKTFDKIPLESKFKVYIKNGKAVIRDQNDKQDLIGIGYQIEPTSIEPYLTKEQPTPSIAQENKKLSHNKLKKSK